MKSEAVSRTVTSKRRGFNSRVVSYYHSFAYAGPWKVYPRIASPMST